VSAIPRITSWPAFRALAAAFIPDTAHATDAQWALLQETVARALVNRPLALQTQIALFIRVLDASSRLRFGRRLDSLDPARCTSLLEWYARSPVLRFRRGIWGLRTLVMMGWYTQPAVIAALGYHADAQGWEARR
jgi:hypothetical protein